MPAFTRPKSYDPASQGYFHNSQGHSENYEVRLIVCFNPS